MSPETTLLAPFAGTVVLAPGGTPAVSAPQQPATLARPRDDLQAVRDRHAVGLDAARHAAVAKRHDQGRRTARENLAHLLDADSFVEYGPMIFAAQERRRSKEELIERAPADGSSAAWARSPASRAWRCPTTTRCWPERRGCATCFAANAALLGCCDVVIATEDASIGMGGPAMIEGGGLGSHHPAEVGPIDVQ